MAKTTKAAEAAKAAQEEVKAAAQEATGNENAPALIDTPEGQIVAPSSNTLAEKFLSGASNFLTSLVDDGSPSSKALIFNAMNDNDGNVSDVLDAGGTLRVTDFMAYPVQLVNQDGELVDAIRCVLVTDEGETYGTVANGVFSSLQKIAAVCGMAPWNPALVVRPVRKKTRNGFYTMTLRLEAE